MLQDAQIRLVDVNGDVIWSVLPDIAFTEKGKKNERHYNVPPLPRNGRNGRREGDEIMRIISREAVQALRECYPRGTRVELVRMDDPQAPPVGTRGTVIGVDDIGSIMVVWDNGSGLSVAYGEDLCRKVANNDDR